MEAGPAADQPSRLRTPPGVDEIGDTFAFRSLTSQGDPRTLRRPEPAHRVQASVRPSGILSATVVPTVVPRSVPAFLAGST